MTDDNDGAAPKRRPRPDLTNALDPRRPSRRRKNLGEQLLEADARRRVLDDPDAGDADGGDPAGQWVENLGPFYDPPAVQALLGLEGEPVTLQAVRERVGLIALTTGSGKVVYPAFQFRGRQLVPGLDRVLAVLPESLVSRWTVAAWLVSPELDLGGERPINVLGQGLAAVDAVVLAARAWAAHLGG